MSTGITGLCAGLVIIQVKLADGCEVLSAFGAAYFKDAIADDRTAVAALVAFFPAKSQQVAAQYFAGCIAVTAMGVAIIDAKFDEAVVFVWIGLFVFFVVDFAIRTGAIFFVEFFICLPRFDRGQRTWRIRDLHF